MSAVAERQPSASGGFVEAAGEASDQGVREASGSGAVTANGNTADGSHAEAADQEQVLRCLCTEMTHAHTDDS